MISACLMFIAQYVLLCQVKECSTIENNIGLVTHNEYLKTKHVKIAWKQELSNQYTQSFNVKEIEQFQSKLTHIMSEMDHGYTTYY